MTVLVTGLDFSDPHSLNNRSRLVVFECRTSSIQLAGLGIDAHLAGSGYAGPSRLFFAGTFPAGDILFDSAAASRSLGMEFESWYATRYLPALRSAVPQATERTYVGRPWLIHLDL